MSPPKRLWLSKSVNGFDTRRRPNASTVVPSNLVVDGFDEDPTGGYTVIAIRKPHQIF